MTSVEGLRIVLRELIKERTLFARSIALSLRANDHRVLAILKRQAEGVDMKIEAAENMLMRLETPA